VLEPVLLVVGRGLPKKPTVSVTSAGFENRGVTDRVIRPNVLNMILLAISHHATVRLAEIGFLLFLIAGVWMVAAETVAGRWSRFRLSISGVLIAVGSVLLIVGLHWGKLGGK